MSDPQPPPTPRMRRALIQHLESLQRAGVSVIGRVTTVESVAQPAATPAAGPPGSAPAETPPSGHRAAAESARPSLPELSGTPAMIDQPAQPSGRPQPKTTPPLVDQPPREPALSLDQRRDALQVLREEVAACTKCPELVAHRTQTVFGVGNPRARLVFFGEAPGADEDRTGEPFVGRAGQLLNKIIEACTLRREDVYIMNVLKCRPPNNRDPSADEASNCRGFFERQLDLLRPEFICCLGKPAMMALLGPPPSTSLGRMRGRLHDYRGSKVIVTYHPAYLLRNPPAKRDTWQDMQLLMREMGIEIPKRGKAEP